MKNDRLNFALQIFSPSNNCELVDLNDWKLTEIVILATNTEIDKSIKERDIKVNQTLKLFISISSYLFNLDSTIRRWNSFFFKLYFEENFKKGVSDLGHCFKFFCFISVLQNDHVATIVLKKHLKMMNSSLRKYKFIILTYLKIKCNYYVH